MKKNIFYISIMSCVFCLTLSTIVYATAFTDSLINYCVPKPGNSCDPKTDKATYTSSGCSCPIGREYNTDNRTCVECVLKGGGYNGYYKSYEGVGSCSQVVCSLGSYLSSRISNSCGLGYYRTTLQSN